MAINFELVKEQINMAVADCYDMSASDVHDNVFDTWKFAKEKSLFELFGNQLKVEKEIEISENEEVLMDSLRTWRNDVLVEISPVRPANVRNLCSIEELLGGILTEDKWLSNEDVVRKGSKVSKLFRKLVPSDKIDEVCTSYSQVVNGRKIKGKLVLSIDPMDYITASYNDLGWSSCYQPYSGEYKSSFNAWMNSDVSFIAYVESHSNPEIDFGNTGIKVSNKKWRTWVSVLPNYVHVNKPYPYQSDNLVSEVFDFVEELVGKKYQTGKLKNEYNLSTGVAYNDTRSNTTWIRKFDKESNQDFFIDRIASNYVVNPDTGCYHTDGEGLTELLGNELTLDEFEAACLYSGQTPKKTVYKTPSTEFKVGDLVRVLHPETLNELYGEDPYGNPEVAAGWCNEMTWDIAGKVFTITGFYGAGFYGERRVEGLDCDYTISTDMIDYVTAPETDDAEAI